MGSLTSHNPIGLQGLLTVIALLFYFFLHRWLWRMKKDWGQSVSNRLTLSLLALFLLPWRWRWHFPPKRQFLQQPHGSTSHSIFWSSAVVVSSFLFPKKSPVTQLLKNCGTRIFIVVLTRALQWSLSWAIRIQCIPLKPVSLRSVLFHLRLGLPSCIFLAFPPKF
jgi:hypothetical protein